MLAGKVRHNVHRGWVAGDESFVVVPVGKENDRASPWTAGAQEVRSLSNPTAHERRPAERNPVDLALGCVANCLARDLLEPRPGPSRILDPGRGGEADNAQPVVDAHEIDELLTGRLSDVHIARRDHAA